MGYVLKVDTQPEVAPGLKFIGPDYDNLYRLNSGVSFDPEMVPKAALLFTRHPAIPDVFPLISAVGCSERFRNLVRRYDPEAAEFFPLAIEKSESDVLDEKFYIINIVQRFDALDIHNSRNIKLKKNSMGNTISSGGQNHNDLCMDESIIGDRHLWIGDNYFSSRIFLSETLGDAMKARKITGFDLIHTR